MDYASRRAALKQQRSVQKAKAYPAIAPVGGLNTKDALANMPETDAIILDNYNAQPSWLEFRGGQTNLATFGGVAETLMGYNAVAANTNEMFAAVNNAGVYSIYRVDNAGGGAVGAAVVGGSGSTVQALTSAQFDYAQFGSGAVNGLVLLDGLDAPLIFDGANWNVVTNAAQQIFTVGTLTGAGTNGTYLNVALTGGTGTGATATVVVAGGNVTSVTVPAGQGGSGYLVGDSLAFTITGGTGTAKVATVSSPYGWSSGPAPLASLRYVGVYKQRLWFIQAGTFNIWYLPQDDLGGAMLELNMAPNFKLGGFLVSIITVSIDNSAGTNDYIAFLSNVGEICMFQGYDPSSVNTWGLSAHFRIGAPVGVGRFCWQKIGMDAAVITTDGVVLLSQAMLTDRSQTNAAVSDKIRYGLSQNIQTYGAFFGWQLLLHPATQKLIVNVPTSASIGTSSFAYAQNTLTGAWSTWGLMYSSHNAVCWETWQNKLYCAGNGSVKLCDQPGIADFTNTSIICSLKPAFNYMGERTTLKRFTQMLPVWVTNGALSIATYLDVDFDPTFPTATVPTSQANNPAWNTSQWNTTSWGDTARIVKSWVGLAGVGYCASPNIQTQVNGITGQLQSLVYVFEEGGAFYGR